MSESTVQPLRRHLTPVLRLAHWVFVAHNQCRLHFLAELDQAVIGIAPENESGIALFESRGNVGNALAQETVGAQVGVRIERHRGKEHSHRLPKRIPGLDRNVECGVIKAALRALHPVDNADA
jgi:hypothetical protein